MAKDTNGAVLSADAKRRWSNANHRTAARRWRSHPSPHLSRLLRVLDTYKIMVVEVQAEADIDGRAIFFAVQIALEDGRLAYIDFARWRWGTNKQKNARTERKRSWCLKQSIPALFLTSIEEAGMQIQVLRWLREISRAGPSGADPSPPAHPSPASADGQPKRDRPALAAAGPRPPKDR